MTPLRQYRAFQPLNWRVFFKTIRLNNGTVCDKNILIQQDVSPDKRAIYQNYLTHVRTFQNALKEAATRDAVPPNPQLNTVEELPQQLISVVTTTTSKDAATDVDALLATPNVIHCGTQTDDLSLLTTPIDMDDLLDVVLQSSSLDIEEYDPCNPGMDTSIPNSTLTKPLEIDQLNPPNKIEIRPTQTRRPNKPKLSKSQTTEIPRPVLRAPYKGPRVSSIPLLPDRPRRRIAGNYTHPFTSPLLDPTIRKSSRPHKVTTKKD